MHKIGSRFTTNYAPDRFEGHILEVIGHQSGYYPYRIKVVAKGKGYESVGFTGDWRDDGNGDMEIIKDNKNIMTTIIEKIRLASKTEPNKTLITRGLLNMDETLTSEGRTLLDFILVQEYGDKLKKAIDAVPVEENK